jgi:hypothetical protein
MGILHPGGMALRLKIPTATTNMKETVMENQKRLAIAGTSFQNVDRSTSLAVAPQVLRSRQKIKNKIRRGTYMFTENRWASRAVEMWILRPPKKNKLSCN